MSLLRKFAIIPAIEMEFISAETIDEAKAEVRSVAEIDGESFYLVEVRAIAKPSGTVIVEEIK